MDPAVSCEVLIGVEIGDRGEYRFGDAGEGLLFEQSGVLGDLLLK